MKKYLFLFTLVVISGLVKAQVVDTTYVNDTIFVYDTVHEVYNAALKNEKINQIKAALATDSSFFRSKAATFRENEINKTEANVNDDFSKKTGNKMMHSLKAIMRTFKKDGQHSEAAAEKFRVDSLNPGNPGKRKKGIHALKYYTAAAAVAATTIHATPANAQKRGRNKPKTADTAVTKKFPGQISFVYPLGSSGKSSKKTAYHLSINALTGVSGAINGAEFGGLSNLNYGHMNGAQFAGIDNINLGTVTGAQFAGITNIAKQEVHAAQFAGIANIVGNNFGWAQFGGIANLVSGNVQGLQVAGILNYVKGNLNGVQIGLINRARKSHGFQLGLINLTDKIEKGFSFGLLNIPKHGFYDEFELSFSDYANTALSYKIGSKKFYTIFTVGTNYIKDNLFLFGGGFGHIIAVSPKFWLQPEIISLNYFPNDFKNTQYNSTNRIKLGLRYNFSKRMAISFAPSIYADVLSNINGTPYQISFIKPVSVIHGKVENVDLGVGFSIALIFY